jgi:hypothetical protein
MVEIERTHTHLKFYLMHSKRTVIGLDEKVILNENLGIISGCDTYTVCQLCKFHDIMEATHYFFYKVSLTSRQRHPIINKDKKSV